MGLPTQPAENCLWRFAGECAGFVDEMRLVVVAHAQCGIECRGAGIQGEQTHGVVQACDARKAFGAKAVILGEFAQEVPPCPASLCGELFHRCARSIVELVEQHIESAGAAFFMPSELLEEKHIERRDSCRVANTGSQLIGEACGGISPYRFHRPGLVMQISQWTSAQVAESAAPKPHRHKPDAPACSDGKWTGAGAEQRRLWRRIPV